MPRHAHILLDLLLICACFFFLPASACDRIRPIAPDRIELSHGGRHVVIERGGETSVEIAR